MLVRILGKVGLGQSVQCDRRSQSPLLQMHERPGQLDQSLVEPVIRSSLPLLQPQVFQHIVRFIELSPVEAVKPSDVPRIPSTRIHALHHRRHLC